MPTPADPACSLAPDIPAEALSNHATAVDENSFYPSSDGEPMVDDMWQGNAMFAAVEDVRIARPDALVAADLFVYPERGNNRWRRAPDVLVALGLGMEERWSYLVWREGKPPDWVLEIASWRTEEKGLREQRHDYAAMGVPEYWLFDPKGGQFPHGMPRLQGFELVRGTYRPIASRMERGVAVIPSEVLGLSVRRDGKLLRFRESATGEDILHRGESEAIVRAAERTRREAARAEREITKRKVAEARVAELEAALRRMQAGSPSETT